MQPRVRKVNIDDKVHANAEDSAAISISLRGGTASVMANKIQVLYHYQVPVPGTWYDTRYIYHYTTAAYMVYTWYVRLY